MWLVTWLVSDRAGGLGTLLQFLTESQSEASLWPCLQETCLGSHEPGEMSSVPISASTLWPSSMYNAMCPQPRCLCVGPEGGRNVLLALVLGPGGGHDTSWHSARPFQAPREGREGLPFRGIGCGGHGSI